MGSYKFYIRFEGNIYGPYSIDKVRELDLLDDTEVMETSVGEWYPANYYNFDELYMKEHGYYVGDDGQIHRIPTSDGNSGNTTGRNTSNNGGNNSDYSDSHICPESAKGWSWGAFVFGWIWGICNKVYWTLLLIPLEFIPIIGPIIGFVFLFILGVKGKEMAWKNGNWQIENVEKFISLQRKWSLAAGWYLAILFILIIICCIFGAN